MIQVAVHRHGCCVLQRCLDAAGPDLRIKLIDEVRTKKNENNQLQEMISLYEMPRCLYEMPPCLCERPPLSFTKPTLSFPKASLVFTKPYVFS